ncbi:exosporium protein D [Bacillus wiedmannii]|uniref:exosporium protein D n=1 Tax=Bacillus wiedmannii TaxID=1890302 RepID=UPI000BF0B811|nr:exosporium protein D [Bacillus wiedmannii]MCU5331633.1 exosporium protein D [Bacillus wiedmannii]PEL93775.1 exosporium protein D [Bacillus wiedmannii]
MADYFYNDSKKCYKKRSDSEQQKAFCSIATHTISGTGINLNGNILLDIFVPPNSTITAFEDFTNNHNKALLQFFVIGGLPPVTVTIVTRNSSRPITVTLEALDTRIFQVEDFKSLIFTNATNENGGVSIFVEKTFCICCNSESNSCDKYYS